MRWPSQPDGHRLADVRLTVCQPFWLARLILEKSRGRVARGQPREIANESWVTIRLRSGTFASTARRAEPLHHDHRACPCLESNQHLPRFKRAPSPDRLQGRVVFRDFREHVRRRTRLRRAECRSQERHAVAPTETRRPKMKKAAEVSQGGLIELSAIARF